MTPAIGLMELKRRALAGHARQVTLPAKEVAARLGLLEEEQMLCEVSALLMGDRDDRIPGKSHWMKRAPP